MDIQENNKLKKDNSWMRPVFIFYAKTTSWVIFPLLIAILTGRYFGQSVGSQTLFFVFVMLGFIVTCLGIYREIREYKKELNKKNGK
jgi:hypothetical protein